jgi:predicted nuclease of predicted toxin-antitoxin system
VIVWIDAQLTPALAPWMSETFDVDALALRDLGLRDAADREIFFMAREADAVVLTKDFDFVRLVEKHGPPPKVLWLSIGNTSNAHLREVLLANWMRIARLFDTGERLVEIQTKSIR